MPSRTLGEQPDQRVGVRRDDLPPQRRITGSDPGDVADPLPAQRQVRLRRIPQLARRQRGQHVREVRRPGHRQIVLLGGQSYDGRAARRAPAPRRALTASGVDVVTRRRRPRCGPRTGPAPTPSDPDRSLPAIGCPPTYRSGRCRAIGSSASGRPLTLPTSVTTAVGYAVSAAAISPRAGPAEWPRPPRWDRGPATRRSAQRGRCDVRDAGVDVADEGLDTRLAPAPSRPRRRSGRPRRRARVRRARSTRCRRWRRSPRQPSGARRRPDRLSRGEREPRAECHERAGEDPAQPGHHPRPRDRRGCGRRPPARRTPRTPRRSPA